MRAHSRRLSRASSCWRLSRAFTLNLSNSPARNPPSRYRGCIKVSGVFQPADGQPPAPIEVVTLSIYAEQEGGVALWQEVQKVAVDTAGRYTVLLGASQPDGLPLEVFAAGEARWMSVDFARAGGVERPRVRIASVPYALKAQSAETLGGRPVSAFLLAPAKGAGAFGAAVTASDPSATPPVTANDILPGTTNFLAKCISSTNLGNSAVFETGGRVGIGTGATTPFDTLHVRFTNTNGGFTGFAVQNMGNSAGVVTWARSSTTSSRRWGSSRASATSRTSTG